ncbi:polyketide synthase [Caballeronia udeis]|uniref:Polyketide synthase n=1 Tax=Caballeronia udeis TaxID=1232866 RepID=A0A158GLW8_9BURK|nr:beta-ketoacyl synthase N-terminal-like domain-containing protein [Caballeronia udeis]SAL32943.1 polyketide synthase [Caballeronia udeis]
MSNAAPLHVLQRLTGVIEATIKLPAQNIDADAEFHALGIDSIIVMELISGIESEFDVALTPAQFADVSTLRELAALLAGLVREVEPARAQAQVEAQALIEYVSSKFSVDLAGNEFGSIEDIADALVSDHADDLMKHYGLSSAADAADAADADTARPQRATDIAIVGLSCTLSDAPNAQVFWTNLLGEKNSVREIPASRWRWQDYYAEGPAPGKTVSKWGALIDDVDCFDAGFFGLSANEAKEMDPQQRLLLQQTYHAIEDAGIDVESLAGTKAGVFVGYQYSEYEQRLRELNFQSLTDGPLFTSSSPTYYLANRISFAFDLRGPSESINVNCASSAVAINRAYYSLVNGESNLALAGGVSLNLFADDYVASSQYGLLSANGTSGVFDNDASGFTRGEGVAMVVLKRLADAQRDNDRIYAVIKSSHQNYRGSARSMSEVRHESITDVLSTCYSLAAVAPESVRYVEVDGYARKWADSFEYEGVKNAFTSRSQNAKRCALGSVKGNIGNVEAASGAVNLIKLTLSLHHKRFPATISKQRINSFLDVDSAAHPLYIADRAIAFEDIREGDVPIRAGINSFADSGTNVHILLEEHLDARATASPDVACERLFVLSASDAGRLEAYVRGYVGFLSLSSTEAVEAVRFDDLVFTAQVGRRALDARLAVVASSREALLAKLRRVLESGLREPVGLEMDGIFHGRVDTGRKNPLAALIGSDMARMQLREAVQSGDWKQIALLWVNGVSMPWRTIWQGASVRAATLPGYPFAKERHWIDFAERTSFRPRMGAVAEPTSPDLSEALADESAAPDAWHFYRLPVSAPHPGNEVPMAAVQRVALLLKHEVARQLAKPAADIAPDKTLIELGMTSIGIAAVLQRVDEVLGIALSPSTVFQHPRIEALAAYLAKTYPELVDSLVVAASGPVADGDTAGGDIVGNEPADALDVPVNVNVLIAIQSKGRKAPIFALPGAGGSALSLQQLSHALGDDQPLYCLEPLGLDGNASSVTSIEAMAEFNLAQLRSVQKEGPYNLFGYSNGGVVAFEMARALMQRNERVASLMLLDTLCPTARDTDVTDMTAAVFRHFVKSLGAVSDLDARALRLLSEGERSAFLYDSLCQLGVTVPKAQFMATVDVATASERACRAYVPGPLPHESVVVLIRASDGFANVPDDYGWGTLVAGQLRTCEIQSDHFAILERESAADVAKKINQYLPKPAGKSASRSEQQRRRA